MHYSWTVVKLYDAEMTLAPRRLENLWLLYDAEMKMTVNQDESAFVTIYDTCPRSSPQQTQNKSHLAWSDTHKWIWFVLSPALRRHKTQGLVPRDIIEAMFVSRFDCWFAHNPRLAFTHINTNNPRNDLYKAHQHSTEKEANCSSTPKADFGYSKSYSPCQVVQEYKEGSLFRNLGKSWTQSQDFSR